MSFLRHGRKQQSDVDTVRGALFHAPLTGGQPPDPRGFSLSTERDVCMIWRSTLFSWKEGRPFPNAPLSFWIDGARVAPRRVPYPPSNFVSALSWATFFRASLRLTCLRRLAVVHRWDHLEDALNMLCGNHGCFFFAGHDPGCQGYLQCHSGQAMTSADHQVEGC